METFATDYKNITETGVVKTTQGILSGMYVNSTNAGTISFIDGYETGAAAVGTLTSTGAMTPASHGQNILTSSGAMIAGTHAVSVLTGNAIVAGNVVVVGTRTYTFRAIPDTTKDEIGLGTSTQEALTNLYNAFNGDYGSITAHTQVVAVTHDATTVTVRGRVPGTSLNSVATTGTALRTVWADTTLGGGTGASDAGVTTGAATVTIGDKVYTVVDELSENYGASAVAYQVKKGANEAAMIANLKLAINGTGTAGTNYSTGTVAHPYFICSASDATTLTIIARAVGGDDYTTAINALATTETMANTAWADTTFGGGAGNSNPAVTTSGATMTIGDVTYTFVDALSESSGSSAIANQILHGAAAANALDNMKLAINATGVAGTNYSTGTIAHPTVIATTNANDSQIVQAKDVGTGGNSIATTDTLANFAWGAATLASGTGKNGKVITGTITPAIGYHNLGNLNFNTGLYATIGGTALNVTLFYK